MYKKMYYQLFNAVTDAIELLERQQFQQALDRLSRAQQEAEELYLAGEEEQE